MKPYYTDERTGILYKLIGDYYFPVGNRFGIADDGDEDVLEMLRSAADGQPTPHAGVFLGRFAEAHRQYLKEHKRSLYSALQYSGKLGQYLSDLDREVREMLDQLVDKMAKQEGVTEALKAADQMRWVQRMENIRNRAMEIVNQELVFA